MDNWMSCDFSHFDSTCEREIVKRTFMKSRLLSLYLHWHNRDSHQLKMTVKNYRFFPFLLHEFDLQKSGVSFIKSSQTEWIMNELELKLKHFEEINKSWSIFASVKQHSSQFHRLSQFFNFSSALQLYIFRCYCCAVVTALFQPVESIHKHIKSSEHRPQHLIRFIQFASIKESPLTWFTDSRWALVCSFSIFIVWHTSILIIHSFYGWHGAEQTGAIHGCDNVKWNRPSIYFHVL